MTRSRDQFRHGAKAGAQPFWLRALALACLLLVGFASSAQAVHVHGQFLPKHDTQASHPVDASQLPGSEANCLLCVAMHSALPVAATVAAPLAVVERTVPAPAGMDRVPDTAWHFAMFSRPPPAVETL